MARKQGDAELMFQFPDLSAQGRLRKAQFFGGAADAAGMRHAHEMPELFQFHAFGPRYAVKA
jgi:hypothetical protein